MEGELSRRRIREEMWDLEMVIGEKSNRLLEKLTSDREAFHPSAVRSKGKAEKAWDSRCKSCESAWKLRGDDLMTSTQAPDWRGTYSTHL